MEIHEGRSDQPDIVSILLTLLEMIKKKKKQYLSAVKET